MKKIALIGFCVAVVLGLIYTFGQPEVADKSQQYFENIQATKEYECTLRREKGEILDGFTYPESISYSKGDITTERINEIDAILKAGLTNIEDCTGVNYHGVSYVQKAYADEPNIEGIKQEIKKNSETWDKLEVKRVAIVRNQTGLNEVNNNLRSRLLNDKGVNMYALALAVSKHETVSCTEGYGQSNTNCQGMKQSRNCPCTLSTENNFCVFKTQEESHQHFICVWNKGYGGELPNLYMAKRYSGNDRAEIRHKNVLQFYKEFTQ